MAIAGSSCPCPILPGRATEDAAGPLRLGPAVVDVSMCDHTAPVPPFPRRVPCRRRWER
jgi:hypothetical protein